MEFHEKLQQLRKQNNMTQEQLAEKLYVSRTAVSKWESGRGYPNLESLKCISKLFSVSIDVLLSNDELIQLAQTENRANLRRLSGLFFGALDVLCLAFLFMPLFGQQEGAHIRAVTLAAYTGVGADLRRGYFICLGLISVFGVFELAVHLAAREKLAGLCKTGSFALCAAAILLFALSRQPYITAFLFLLFVLKFILAICEKSP